MSIISINIHERVFISAPTIFLVIAYTHSQNSSLSQYKCRRVSISKLRTERRDLICDIWLDFSRGSRMLAFSVTPLQQVMLLVFTSV
jgi:hypothetical protein